MIGIYIHVPFCAQKCPYCDFYSVPWRIPLEEQYLSAVRRDLRSYADRNLSADTLYFGGGTPSLIQPQSIAALIREVKQNFRLAPNSEITLECNPCTVTAKRAGLWAEAGINRVSLGMQSSSAPELRMLGRKHSPDMVKNAVQLLRKAGISNISLDVMLALPHQTTEMISATIDFAASLQVQHISAYLLQIEPDTPFARSQQIAFCPDDDEAASMYLHAVERLASHGYAQYEISNFARHGFESKHNNKYWEYAPYLGFEPAAHSFFDGKRSSYPSDLTAYLTDGKVEYSDLESDAAEFAMLQLRLTKGLSFSDYAAHGGDVSALKRQISRYQNTNLLLASDSRVRLTPQGFLLSNALMADLLL